MITINKVDVMDFLEDLTMSDSSQCPLSTGVPDNITVYRFIENNPPIIDDFWSHSKKGKRILPMVNECQWRSCSVFTSLDVVMDMHVNGIPKFRSMKILKMILHKDDGCILCSGSHCDWWISTTFDISKCIIGIIN
jgi:hypothetical protein